MQHNSIPATRVPKSSALLADYLDHYERVAAFYGGNPRDLGSLRALAEGLNRSDERRRKVAEILLRQNQALGCGPETVRNIERLAQAGTLAVVTGQQTGFFSGPAFTLYKALTAVKLAECLRQQELAAVPVFWLASEDHDLEEVARANVLDDADEVVALGDAGERPAPQSSVGYVKLSSGVASALERLELLLPPGESRDRLLSDLGACYQTGATWAGAFGRFMTRLFSRWGVVLLDPLDEAIHRLSAPVYLGAIARADELRRALRERSLALIKAGYHAQVHVGDDSTLVFMQHEGCRLPLHHRDGQGEKGYFLTDDEDLSLAELREKVQAEPLTFSANVLLRPAVQDCLLPTIAYVAGPSELAYFGQAQVLYQAFGRPMPVIFPRAAFTLLDARARRLMEKYRLSLEDVWQGVGHLGQKIGAAGLADGWTERFEQYEQELNLIMERLRADIEALDPTLLDALRHTEEKIKYQVERLKGKMTRAALGRSELLRRHEEILLRYLTPERNLQERVVSGAYFLGRAGYQLLDRLLERIDLKSFDHQLFEL
jgi:bacillithiol biosynthesis cysteine-adding enzyme BshC